MMARLQAAPETLAGKIDPLLAFYERAEARAYLYAVGQYTLHEAVDRLAADAERDGIDTDVAQAVMAVAFESVQPWG